MASEVDNDIVELTSNQQHAVDEFCAFTGSTPEAAKQALEACNWDLEMAVTVQMEDCEPLRSAPSSSAPPSASSNQLDEDNIRAPIPPVRQVLVDDFVDMDVPLMNTRSRSGQIPMFRDNFRDFQSEARFREELAAATSSSDSESLSESAKRRTLEELFRPPIDIIFPGSMEAAKDRGIQDNRWLMIDIQDDSEFACQCLNRDVWSNTAVRSILSEYFVFWQVNRNQREGLRYAQFYPIRQFPHVAILDPRTGEQMVCWNTIKDSNMFCELVTDFLQNHPTPSGEAIPDQPAPVVVTLPDPDPTNKPSESVDMSEDEQLNAAIAASLQEPIKIDDDDEVESFSYEGEESPIEINNHVNASNECEEEIQISDGEKKSGKSKENNEEKKINETKSADEDYTKYLGNASDMADLVLRFPDGRREKLAVPSDSLLKAIILLVQSKGFSQAQYDLVANFPRRNIHEMSHEATLASLGLMKEQLYIQLKQHS